MSEELVLANEFPLVHLVARNPAEIQPTEEAWEDQTIWDEEAEWEDGEPTCGCPYCFCPLPTIAGESCSDCSAGVHCG